MNEILLYIAGITTDEALAEKLYTICAILGNIPECFWESALKGAFDIKEEEKE